MLTRRRFVEAIGAAGAAVGLQGLASAQTPQAPQTPGPPSTVTIPPRDFGPNGPPTTYFTDPDIRRKAADYTRALHLARRSVGRVNRARAWYEAPLW